MLHIIWYDKCGPLIAKNVKCITEYEQMKMPFYHLSE